MFKKLVSKILLIFFLGFLIIPSAILLIDNTVDVSVFYDMNDENEKKANEKNLEIEIQFTDNNFYQNELNVSLKNSKINYISKKYNTPYLNFITPPPDLL